MVQTQRARASRQPGRLANCVCGVPGDWNERHPDVTALAKGEAFPAKDKTCRTFSTFSLDPLRLLERFRAQSVGTTWICNPGPGGRRSGPGNRENLQTPHFRSVTRGGSLVAG